MSRNGVLESLLKFCVPAAAMIVSLWGLGWLVTGAMYCSPNVEDFSLSIDPRDHGLLISVTNLLVFFDSRYTANLLHGLNPLAFGEYRSYTIIPLFCILSVVCSVYFFLSSITDFSQRRAPIVVLAVVMVVMHFLLVPSLPYGLYYMASTFTYVYPWVFMLVWIGAFLRTVQTPSKNIQVRWTVIGFFSMTLSYGCSELFIPINLLVLVIGIAFGLFFRREIVKTILPYALLSFGVLLFIFICPSGKFLGEKITYGAKASFSLLFLKESIASYRYFLSEYVIHPLFIVFIPVVALLIKDITFHPAITKFAKSSTAILLMIGLVAMSFVVTWIFFIPMSPYNDFPASIFNCVSVIIQFVFWVLIPLSIRQCLVANFGRLMAVISSTLLISFVLTTSNNSNKLKNDFVMGYMEDLRQKTTSFYQAVERSRREETDHKVVYIENPNVIPASIFLRNDILPNRVSACWNIAYEDYFGVDEVRLKGDTIFK